VRAGRGDLIVELVGELPVVADAIDRLRHVDFEGVLDGFADIECLEQSEMLEILTHQLGEAQQYALALFWLGSPPAAILERGARGPGRRIAIRLLAAGDLRNHAAVDRGFLFECAPSPGADQLAIDDRASFRAQRRSKALPVATGSWIRNGVHGVHPQRVSAVSQVP